MKNILVVNQKGGVGKSLIADEIAWSFERSKIPISFADLDSQGGVCHASVQRPDARAMIVDTPGALQASLRDWLEAADVVVIPTRPTSRDIEPLQRMIDAVQAAGCRRVVYVINGYNRFRASGDFLDWLKGNLKGEKIMKLPQSEMFVQASAAGMSVAAYARHTPAARATLELVNVIRKAAGFPAE